MESKKEMKKIEMEQKKTAVFVRINKNVARLILKYFLGFSLQFYTFSLLCYSVV